MRRARQAVIKSLKCVKSRGEDTTLHEINLALCQSVEELRQRLNISEGRVLEIDERYEKNIKNQADKIEDNELILMHQYDAIRSLSIQVKLLEGIALGVRHFFVTSCISIC